MTEPVLDLDTLRQSGRDDRGRFLPGNLASLRHGLRMAPDHPDLAAHHRDRVELIVADLGGMSQLSAVKMALVRELAFVTLVAESLRLKLANEGPLTGKGSTRAATTLYLHVVSQQLKLSERLGLDRVAKQAMDLHGYAKQKGATS